MTTTTIDPRTNNSTASPATTTAPTHEPLTQPIRDAHAAEPDAVPVQRQTLRRAIASEWIKIRSLRGTWIGTGSLFALLVGFAALAAQFTTADTAGPESGGPLSTVLMGANFGVLLAGVLGGLAGAREFSSRMISSTVAAVPRRWQVVVAKATALTAVVLPASLIGVFGAYAIGMPILAANDAATVALSDTGVLSSLIGMAGYLTAIALVGLGLGTLLRNVSGAIAAIVGGILILPTLAGSLLPNSWDTVLQYLPSSAASAFTEVMSSGDAVLSSAAGVLVLAGWVLLTLGAAVLAFTRRDV